jgi:hypothetical protein
MITNFRADLCLLELPMITNFRAGRGLLEPP